VRILLRLRKEFIDHPMAPAGQDDGGRMENIEEVLESDISSRDPQSEELTNLPITPAGQDDGARTENIEKALDSDMSSRNSESVEAVKDLKMKQQSGDVVENKGSGLENRRQSGNIIENKCSYAQNAGMLLKTNASGGIHESHGS
jgi:hypothetical protein